jgi:site-specific DNA recombinase
MKALETAAMYLRSSRDKHDVSIDAQRRDLKRLASEKGLSMIREYVDVVESAKDEHRPGFQVLLHDLKRADRGWSTLLLVDTSRLSRRRFMAQVFKHEAEKRGVKIWYSRLPESDPITDLVIQGVMEVFDELHSLMSREKGKAGMAENVRQGYRAGGRAPFGYRLQSIETGAIREGAPVLKSRLVPDDNAPLIQRYLTQRAEGLSRTYLIRRLGLRLPETTLIGIEWNALTYAGHTIWNVHNERGPDGYKGGTKRRPRDQWIIQRDTHEPLITEQEAEAILARLSCHSARASRRTPAAYLLTGILKAPIGQAWHGDKGGEYYRCGSRSLSTKAIDKAVISKVSEDLQSHGFAAALAARARAEATRRHTARIETLKKRISACDARISRFLDMASELASPEPAIRKINRHYRE